MGSPRAPEPIRLAPGILSAIETDLARTPHLERCGLISGKRGIGRTIHLIPNCAADPRRAFMMAPDALIAAFARIEAAGETLTAIYHSHPNGPAMPSASDVAQAHYRDAGYLIGAWESGGLEVRGFRWTETDTAERFIEVRVEVEMQVDLDGKAEGVAQPD